MVSLKHVQTKTPTPGPAWLKWTADERLVAAQENVRSGPAGASGVVVIAAKPDGQIIVNLSGSLSPSKRGPLLLDLETSLKETIDPSLVVWLEPLGDKNSLRNLRGIEVKS
jgi:hypothetical protein